jgi:hypothetical protein
MPPTIAPTLSMTSAWKVPSAMRASTCRGDRAMAFQRFFHLLAEPLRQGPATLMPWQ